LRIAITVRIFPFEFSTVFRHMLLISSFDSPEPQVLTWKESTPPTWRSYLLIIYSLIFHPAYLHTRRVSARCGGCKGESSHRDVNSQVPLSVLTILRFHYWFKLCQNSFFKYNITIFHLQCDCLGPPFTLLDFSVWMNPELHFLRIWSPEASHHSWFRAGSHQRPIQPPERPWWQRRPVWPRRPIPNFSPWKPGWRIWEYQ